jgi:hypothetical protein
MGKNKAALQTKCTKFFQARARKSWPSSNRLIRGSSTIVTNAGLISQSTRHSFNDNVFNPNHLSFGIKSTICQSLIVCLSSPRRVLPVLLNALLIIGTNVFILFTQNVIAGYFVRSWTTNLGQKCLGSSTFICFIRVLELVKLAYITNAIGCAAACRIVFNCHITRNLPNIDPPGARYATSRVPSWPAMTICQQSPQMTSYLPRSFRSYSLTNMDLARPECGN